MRKPTRRAKMHYVSSGDVCKVKGISPAKFIVVVYSEGGCGGAKIRSWDQKRKSPFGKARYVPYSTFWDIYERDSVRVPKVGDVLERIGFGYCGPHIHVKVESVTKEEGGEVALQIISCKLGKENSTIGGRRSTLHFDPFFYERFYILDTTLEKKEGMKKMV